MTRVPRQFLFRKLKWKGYEYKHSNIYIPKLKWNEYKRSNIYIPKLKWKEYEYKHVNIYISKLSITLEIATKFFSFPRKNS